MSTTTTTFDAPAKAPPPVRTFRKNGRQPRRLVDTNGDHVAHVPLKGGAIAILDAADLDHVVALGVTTQWVLNGDGKGFFYVRTKLPGSQNNVVAVARLILDVPDGMVVRYVDGNTLNLRRSNLFLDAGFSKRLELTAKVCLDDVSEF